MAPLPLLVPREMQQLKLRVCLFHMKISEDVGDSFPIRAVATDSFELYFSNVVNKDNHKPPKMMFSYLEHCHKGWLTYQEVTYKIQVIRPVPLHQPPQANGEKSFRFVSFVS